MPKHAILGLSAFYHDSAAALLVDGNIAAAVQEERFTRLKHDPGFPRHSIQFCLTAAGLQLSDLAAVVFYDKPLLTFDRLLETYMSYAPRGVKSFIARMPLWLKDKLVLKRLLRLELMVLGGCTKQALPPLLFTEHHQAHAASAFYPSPFDSAAVLCLDGVGEWATTSAWRGEAEKLEALWQINFPDSLGLLYSAFTAYTGFRVNSGEYKLMGLAPYGQPRYEKLIREHLVEIREDGSYRLNQDYFDYCVGERMTSPAFHDLFGGAPRKPESALGEKEMDLAASIQAVTEDIVLRLARTLQTETGEKNLCLAGGVALNCSANGKLAGSGIYETIWVQPAASDAGAALGAALAGSYLHEHMPRSNKGKDVMQGSYLGPAFDTGYIRTFLEQKAIPYTCLEDSSLFSQVAELLADGQVIGWLQGAMEFGPRALGNRSILADPRRSDMQSRLNLKIKFRESFRPFAPSILEEDVDAWFDFSGSSPYMAFVANIKKELREQDSEVVRQHIKGLEKITCRRSGIPAVTHVDYSARLQTVSKSDNPRFYRLISAFKTLTGCPLLVNTSFNVRGEPIVCTPEQAYHCFIHTDMDYLVLGNCVLEKNEADRNKSMRVPTHAAD